MNLRGPLGQKVPPLRSDALRQSARMQSCTLRLPGCNGRLDTTVLAHVRAFGNAGMGQKPHDLHAVFACHACHDLLDGRRSGGPVARGEVLRALLETQSRWIAAGLIEVRK